MLEGMIVPVIAVLLLVLQTVNTMLTRRQDNKTAAAILEIKEEVAEQRLDNKDIKAVGDQLLEMHRHFDQDGTPLWYVPRSWSGTQSKIVEICQQISNTQVLLVQAMERLEAKM